MTDAPSEVSGAPSEEVAPLDDLDGFDEARDDAYDESFSKRWGCATMRTTEMLCNCDLPDDPQRSADDPPRGLEQRQLGRELGRQLLPETPRELQQKLPLALQQKRHYNQLELRFDLAKMEHEEERAAQQRRRGERPRQHGRPLEGEEQREARGDHDVFCRERGEVDVLVRATHTAPRPRAQPPTRTWIESCFAPRRRRRRAA